jgi:mannose-6-phosphate isomerase-like protein (cupin superfamily)
MIEKMIPQKNGFYPVCENEKFKCAFITAAEQYQYGEITQMKRHNTSDEIYVLLEGGATLVTKEQEFSTLSLEKGCAYRLAAGTWHALCVTEDAKLFVCENNEVSAANTDTLNMDSPYIVEIS